MTSSRRLAHGTRTRLSIVLGGCGCAILLALIAFTPIPASAHETRTVGADYEFETGFIDEPAI